MAVAEQVAGSEAARLRAELAATQELVRLIAGDTDLQTILEAVTVLTARLIGTGRATVTLLDGDRLAYRTSIPSIDGRLWLQSVVGGTVRRRPLDAGPDEGWVTVPEAGQSPSFRAVLQGGRLDPGSVLARAVLERRTVALGDLFGPEGDDFPTSREIVRQGQHMGTDGYTSIASTPLLRGDQPLGALAVMSTIPHHFTPHEITLLETFAAQAALAIENARLVQDLQERLEEQTATGRVLEVISRSPTDLQTVLDSIADSAALLCEAERASLGLVRGQEVHVVASSGANVRPTLVNPASVRPLERTLNTHARAIVDRAVVHFADLAAVPVEEMAATSIRAAGIRSLVTVPFLSGDSAIGAISVSRLQVRPFTERQVALIQTFADQAVIAIENARLFSELRARDDRRRQELERAAAIQQRLLPETVDGWPGVLEVAVRFRPAVETSGDFYDVLRLPPTREAGLPPLQIAVGDVAGKGMSAALVTALARSALRSSTSVPVRALTPAGILRETGARLHQDVGGGHFVACALAVVEPPNQLHAGPRLTLSNAAQVPVLLARNGDAREIEPPGDRLPLGARLDGDYEDTKIELLPGDVVIFASDGLVEAPSLAIAAVDEHLPPPTAASELFGFARLAASAAHWSQHTPTAEAVAHGIWSDLTAWCGDHSPHDDMTLLVLRVPVTPRRTAPAEGATAG
ncbi:MAG TPA: SpoIIE family protein phosphatase [Chloroflexota bacterium]|nr:SpoIIE family protein phosphatase [Chloroflexota bacterium]